MAGTRRGIAAAALRAALSVAEPFYTGAIRTRNKLFDLGWRESARLPRPVISIGNITAGGTGKTPMVRWLASRLRDEGQRVAVLSRGYKASENGIVDELLMLDRLLNAPFAQDASSDSLGSPSPDSLPGTPAPISQVKLDGKQQVVLRANPNRRVAAAAVLRDHPKTDVFLLDDGFQHRAVARDLDIVLLNAAEPFGFDHVLPRGLLREPIGGFRRAGAIIITHADQVTSGEIVNIESRLRELGVGAPVFHSMHELSGLRTADLSASAPANRPLSELNATPFFAFCGIGAPHLLHRQLQSFGASYVGHRWFADHQAYSESDVRAVQSAAVAAGARVLVTTEKDWVKLQSLVAANESSLPIWRLDVELRFRDQQESAVMNLVRATISGAAPGKAGDAA